MNTRKCTMLAWTFIWALVLGSLLVIWATDSCKESTVEVVK